MEKDTKGVSLLRSDPKMAVVKLSLPIMIAQVVQALYNLVDSIWVAGLGPEALAGIGLFFPIFMIILAFFWWCWRWCKFCYIKENRGKK